MENNQEHKLDNFFKKSLENQAFPPPENLWSNIAAETIAKEGLGIKPLLKYTMLSLGLMIVSAITLWFLTDDEIVKEHHQKIASLATELHPKQILVDPSDERAIKNSTPNEVKPEKNDIDNSRSKLVSFVNHIEKESVKPTVHSKYTTYTGLRSTKINDVKTNHSINQALIETDNNNTAILATDNKLVNNNLNTLNHKNLVLNDLSLKNDKNLIEKIRPIQQTDKEARKHSYKPESTGSKFSLRHPIISLDYGVLSNTWEFKSENSLEYNVVYPEKNSGTFLKANIAWKITEKSRMGISVAYNSYNLGTPYFNIPLWSSYFGIPTVYLNTKNGKQYYNAIMPVGTVNIPTEKFDGIVKQSPDTIYSSRKMIFSGNHRMTTFSLGITTQYDFLTLQSKKKKHLNLKIYGIADFTFQRQIAYHYTAKDLLAMVSSTGGTINNNSAEITYDSKHLENASDFIFGIRAGLGIRWQFAPRLGLHVEGTTQNSFNSWVQNQELKSYMRTNALQAGINWSL